MSHDENDPVRHVGHSGPVGRKDGRDIAEYLNDPRFLKVVAPAINEMFRLLDRAGCEGGTVTMLIERFESEAGKGRPARLTLMVGDDATNFKNPNDDDFDDEDDNEGLN